MATPSPKSQCSLEPVNFQDRGHFGELQRQRILCGWHHDPPTLQKWKDKQREGRKNLFWITIPSPHDEENNELIRAGHISLDAYCEPPELGLARADKTILTISSFFLLPEYRAYGLGRRAMELVEGMAVTEPYGSPNCRFIALTALSKRYMYDEGPEWRGMWARIGMELPSFSIQEWYEKLGYVSWKEEPLYEEKALDGTVVVLWEAFMKKELRPAPDASEQS